MNDYENKFKQIADNLKVDDRPNAEHKQALRQQMLAEFDESSSSTPHHGVRPIWSKIMKSNITKSAAAAIIILGVFLLLPNEAALAWSQVLEQIKESRPYQCKLTVYDEGNKPRSRVTMHLSLSQRREERDDGLTYIFDMRQCPIRTLVLDDQNKQARLSINYDMGPAKDPDMLRMLANMKESDTEVLDVSEIDGIETQAFRSVSQHNDITIWADVETGLPVKVQIIHINRGRRIVLEDLQFDVPFDESLFSTQPPEGYQLHEVVRGKKPDTNEDAMVQGEANPDVVGPELFVPHSCVLKMYRNDKVFFEGREFYKTLSIRRQEHFDDGSIHIIDITEKPAYALRLEPVTKKAILTIYYDKGGTKIPDMLAKLAGMRNGNAEKLGLENIDGFQAEGFRQGDGFVETTIWADTQTDYPVRIEIVHPKRRSKTVYSDFDFATEYDEAFFSTDPPEDYDLKEEIIGLEADVKQVTKEHVRQTATQPVYVLRSALSWTKNPFILEITIGPTKETIKDYSSVAVGNDGRHVVIGQSEAHQALRGQIRSGGNKCLEIDGFTVWNGGPEKWYSKTMLEGAKGAIPPGISEDRTGYAIETPSDTILVIGVNGKLTDDELLEMVQAMELCSEPQ